MTLALLAVLLFLLAFSGALLAHILIDWHRNRRARLERDRAANLEDAANEVEAGDIAESAEARRLH